MSLDKVHLTADRYADGRPSVIISSGSHMHDTLAPAEGRALLTDREHAAFRTGLRHAADLALITAMTIEVRDDAHHIRQRAAIEALRGLAEGLKAASPNSETA